MGIRNRRARAHAKTHIIGFSLAGVVGPLIMQKIFSEFASYRPSFPIAIVFALIGIALTFLYRAVNRKLAQKSA